MSDTQIPALDHSVQQINIWLKALGEELHTEDRHDAYLALRAVLHVLRDRLTPEQAAHLGAQLPTIVRGLFYEGWRLSAQPGSERQPADFAALVAAQLPPPMGRDALRVAKAVFRPAGERARPGRNGQGRGDDAGSAPQSVAGNERLVSAGRSSGVRDHL